ncbi:MAG: RecX family transcriptional regulator [Sphingomonadales bacterium]|nr:RecX family transcriptional regulator [Sphingomonadales bacterium]
MPPRTGHRPRPPLDAAQLDELALHYVGRFATSRSKLTAYLKRKLRERGWAGERDPDPELIAEKLAGLGYVDDAAFALGKARALSGRGYGARRVGQALYAAGISEEDGADARVLAVEARVDAALRLARRRRIGPFASTPLAPAEREKAIAALIRAGHGSALARALVHLPPGGVIDEVALADLR